MPPVSTEQNVRLTGYISYQDTNSMVGVLKESLPVKQSGLSELFTEIRNSAAEFFTAVKGTINNVLESLGYRINKVTTWEEKTQFDADQSARMALGLAQKNVQGYLDKVNKFLKENKTLDAASLQDFSNGTLRPLVTLLSGVGKIKGTDKASGVFTDGLIRKVNSVLSGAAGCSTRSAEKVSQLTSICDDEKAGAYLATENFEQDFKVRMTALVADIEGSIMTDLMDLSPAEVVARVRSQTRE